MIVYTGQTGLDQLLYQPSQEGIEYLDYLTQNMTFGCAEVLCTEQTALLTGQL